MRGWSVNTWIIAICIAVFVVDGFTPTRPVVMGRTQMEAFDRVDSSLIEYGDLSPAGTRVAQRPLYVTTQTPAGPARVHVATETVQRMYFLESLLHFSTRRGFFEVQFWRLIGFQFLHTHDTFMHIAFNMMGLFFFGPLVERALGGKRYLAFYLLCGIAGALMYTLLNVLGIVAKDWFNFTQVPFLLFNNFTTPLIGASAGVFGVIMAGAFLAPKAKVLLFMIIPMELRLLAYLIVGIALYTLITNGNNAGGEAGHLGGAIAGFYFIRHPHHLHGFFDVLGRIDPTSHHYRPEHAGAGPQRGRTGTTAARPTASRRGADPKKRARAEREVDRILDKVTRDGLASLTERERQVLRESSND